MKEILCKRKTKKPIGYRFSAVLAGVGLLLSATAASEETSQVISLPEAVMMTLNYHPELKALLSQEPGNVWAQAENLDFQR